MNKDKTFAKASDITAATIASWKKTNKRLLEIDVPLEDNDIRGKGKCAKFFICSPTRSIINAVAKYGSENNIEKANEVLMTNCVLGGDMEYLDEDEHPDGEVYYSVLEEIGKLNGKRKAIVKKQ